jgi:hypothetical protein
MTVYHATNKLIEFFAQNDTFYLEDDFKKIVLISDNDGDKAALLAGLDELTKQNLVIKKNFNDKDYWVLLRPLAMQNQDVSVPLALGLEISKLLNETEPKDPSRSDPLNLNSQDILNLFILAKKS